MVSTEEMSPRRTARAESWAINGLGLYVLIMYGITYYAVTTAAPRIAADLGVSLSLVFGLLTLSLLTTAVLAPHFGRWTDGIGAHRVLLIGAVLRAFALVGMALAGDPWLFALAFLAVQVLGQLTEYDATFAAAVGLRGAGARGAMSQITLWGGLASTVFWPVTAYLLEVMSWRTMFLAYAALLIVVCVPIAAFLTRLPSAAPQGEPAHGNDAAAPAAGGEGGRAPPFLLVAAAFAFGGICYNLPSLMLPVLEGLGLGASALVVGMLFGPSQTAGRFFDMLLGGRVHATTVAVVAASTVALSLIVLLIGGVWSGLAFAVLFGAGAGVAYVVRGSVVLALYGPVGYATWLGRLGTIRLTVTAISPFGLSLVLENFGARPVILVCGLAALVSLACFVLLARRTGPAARLAARA